MVGNNYLLILLLVNFSLVMGGFKKTFSTVLFGNKGSHDLKDGERSTQPQDSLLLNEVIMNNKQPLTRGIIDGTYCYPPSDTINDHTQIVVTMYEAKDLVGSGTNGGEAFLKSGGIGQNQVCVYIKSQYGGYYNFKFNVYGYRQDLAKANNLQQSQ